MFGWLPWQVYFLSRWQSLEHTSAFKFGLQRVARTQEVMAARLHFCSRAISLQGGGTRRQSQGGGLRLVYCARFCHSVQIFSVRLLLLFSARLYCSITTFPRFVAKPSTTLRLAHSLPCSFRLRLLYTYRKACPRRWSSPA
eukprot:Amastigsp_a508393_6.p3 type:complete len:141 gc:universal Amastigsp_a508393_6:2848-3270(+)